MLMNRQIQTNKNQELYVQKKTIALNILHTHTRNFCLKQAINVYLKLTRDLSNHP